MKGINFKRVILWGMVALLAGGCKVTDAAAFEQISTQRVTEYIDACNEVLGDAPHGWKLVYYTDAEQYGAYTFLMKFDQAQNRVSMRWDGSDEESQSSYSFNTSQGPVLNFATYSLLHRLADPNPDVSGGKAGIGYKGEYEFVINGVSDDKNEVFLETKNGKLPITLVKATEKDWADFDKRYVVTARFKSDFDADPKFYRYMTLGGQKALFFYSLKLRMAYFAFDGGGTGTVTTKRPWSLTPDGMLFDKPVTIGGVTFEGLTIDAGGSIGLLNPSPQGAAVAFSRTANTADKCELRFPGAVASSSRIDGFNLVEYGSELQGMIREAEGYGMQDFRFYWNLMGKPAAQVYLQVAAGVAKYAGQFDSNTSDIPGVDTDDGIDYSVGDQVVFTVADAAGRTVIEGAVNNDDNLWFAGYYRASLGGAMGQHFMHTGGHTVIDFGGQFVMVRNNDNRAWALYTPKEGMN